MCDEKVVITIQYILVKLTDSGIVFGLCGKSITGYRFVIVQSPFLSQNPPVQYAFYTYLHSIRR